MKAVLPDTNAIVALFRGDQAVLDMLARAEIVYASAIVIGDESETVVRKPSDHNVDGIVTGIIVSVLRQ